MRQAVVPLPLAGVDGLGRAARRSRVGLGLVVGGIVAAAALAAVAASQLRMSVPVVAAPRSSGVVVVDISGSIDGGTFREAAGVLDALYRGAGPGGRLGLVAFSDVADTILPPTAPRRVFLEALRRYLPMHHGQDALRPSMSVVPLFPLVGGTSISTGLAAADRALWRAGIRGRIYLVSDLQDSSEDLRPALRELRHLHAEGIAVRVVKLGHGAPTLKLPEGVARLRAGELERGLDVRAAAPGRAPRPVWPVALIVLAGLVAVAVCVLVLAFPRIHFEPHEVGS